MTEYGTLKRIIIKKRYASRHKIPRHGYISKKMRVKWLVKAMSEALMRDTQKESYWTKYFVTGATS